jgi:predicted transcriptional regulator of viral defense system
MQTERKETDILTVEEVAEWLRVTPSWVRAHANKNRRPFLPGFKAGKYVRFERGTVRLAVAKWQQEREVS